MAEKPHITVETLRQLLRPDFEAGVLTWMPRSAEWFRSARSFGMWNSRYAGTFALNTMNGQGYLGGAILGQSVVLHRAIWAMYSGAWPDADIDHINGVKTDNRIVNLRHVPHVENMRNQKRRLSNKSGVQGVSWDEPEARWRVTIRNGGRQITVGRFTSFADAVAARKAAEDKYGFHPNHGRAA